MTAIAARLEQAIGGLREHFLQGLPKRLDVIVTTLERPTARDVERAFHNLAGTAATYGLFGIAGIAAEGEQICDDACDILDGSTRLRLRVLVERLRIVSLKWQSRMPC